MKAENRGKKGNNYSGKKTQFGGERFGFSLSTGGGCQKNGKVPDKKGLGGKGVLKGADSRGRRKRRGQAFRKRGHMANEKKKQSWRPSGKRSIRKKGGIEASA